MVDRKTPESKVAGTLQVGVDENRFEVVINLPEDMTGHVCFSPTQARDLAALLIKHADLADELFNGGKNDVERQQVPEGA